jgi:hypothetical protein
MAQRPRPTEGVRVLLRLERGHTDLGEAQLYIHASHRMAKVYVCDDVIVTPLLFARWP